MRESVNIGHIQTDAWAYTVGRTKEEGQEKVGDRKGEGVTGRSAIAMQCVANRHSGLAKGRDVYGVYTIQGAPATHDVLFPAVCYVCKSLFRQGR